MRRGIPYFLARGGGSRGIIVLEDDLVSIPRSQWHNFFAFWLGSPDPTGRQLDGVGGGNPSTSKVVILKRSIETGIEYDYDFFQIDPVTGVVEKRGTCGNLIAAVALLVVSEEFVPIGSPATIVNFFDINTQKRIEVTVPLAAIPTPRIWGSAFQRSNPTDAVISTKFLNPDSATTGSLYPAGSSVEEVNILGHDLHLTLIDAVNPVVLTDGFRLGLSPNQTPGELEADLGFMKVMQEIRNWGAWKCGFATSPESAPNESSFLPFVGVTFGRVDYVSLSGATVEASEVDLVLRMLSGSTVHRALPLSAGLAAAAHTAMTTSGSRAQTIRLGHPSGTMSIDVALGEGSETPTLDFIAVDSTARILSQGYLRTE